jgi:hypothetical protein
MNISRSQGFIDQGDDVPCQPALRNHDNTNTSISQVGAFLWKELAALHPLMFHRQYGAILPFLLKHQQCHQLEVALL